MDGNDKRTAGGGFYAFRRAVSINENLILLTEDLKEDLPKSGEALRHIREAAEALEKAWKVLWPSGSAE